MLSLYIVPAFDIFSITLPNGSGENIDDQVVLMNQPKIKAKPELQVAVVSGEALVHRAGLGPSNENHDIHIIIIIGYHFQMRWRLSVVKAICTIELG